MTGQEDPLRRHLARALVWDEAHLDLDDALKGLPAAKRGKRPKGLAHSPWELLEHVRLAQRDLLAFCTRADYVAGRWPEDYWPTSPEPPRAGSWKASVDAVVKDRATLQAFVADAPDLFADVPSAKGKSVLRAILLAIDHTSYHLGQLVLAVRLLRL